MKTVKRENIMSDLDFKNKFYVFLLIVLAAVLIIQTLFMFVTGKQQTVVIIPKGLENTVQVGQSEASQEYLLAMGNYATFLFLNFDSTTVVAQYDTLSSLSSNVVRAEAIQTAEDYRKSGVSSRCVVNKVEVTDQSIKITGRRIKYILDKPMEDKAFTLNITYEVRFGTFRIAGLELI